MNHVLFVDLIQQKNTLTNILKMRVLIENFVE